MNGKGGLKALKRMVRWRTILILMFIMTLLWFISSNSKQNQRPIELKQEVIINSIDQVKKLDVRPTKKVPKPLSSQLNVVEIDADRVENTIQHKPRVQLPLPAEIMQHVGGDEWISRSIYDKKVHCARKLQKARSNNTGPKSNITCQIPYLDPFDPSIMKYVTKSSRSNCNRFRTCGKLVNGIFHITDRNVVSAIYRGIFRRGDFNYEVGSAAPVSATEEIKQEFVEIECKILNGRILREFWLQPVPHPHLLERKAKRRPGLPLNVLIVGVDSLSHANARRKLPKFYEYLKNELGALLFNGHSIVGDGTTEQLAAILTGLGELEQYEARRHHRNPRPVDGWAWIYRELTDHGYITGYSGDAPHVGPFQYRLLGFQKPPTDLYTRPFYQRSRQHLRGGKDYCLGSMNIAQHQFKYIRDVFDTFPEKLKFLFSYNVLFSHDDFNEVEKIEPDLLSLVRDLNTRAQLNNTLLIVMGDHGSRFGFMRREIQGKLEERLPLFGMVFPPWFSEKYPKLYENLRVNTDRLTSWYDLHATFRHMLSYPDLPSNIKHGQSLLLEVPASRTCAQANIAPHWCPCQEWSAVDTMDSHVQNAAQAVVEFMNSLNGEHEMSRKFCEILNLKTVIYAAMEEPNEKVLTFHQTNDLRPAFQARARPVQKDICRYQIQLETSPNNGIYEATVKFHLGWFIVSKIVSRVNAYDQQPDCIAKTLPHLRKFCFCNVERNATNSSG